MDQATANAVIPPYRLSMAPMMDYTDRHDRYFMRLISRHALLYTEMVTTAAILHGDPHRLLDFDPSEHPVALQLGGSDPADLAQCAKIAEQWGYDEVNLNVGCPSDRVQSGRFGACLMAEPNVVADCVKAMSDAVSLPITVKTRIGVDNRDSYEELCEFISAVAAAGCELFIIHARKCWLQGLSPKQNREIPPLSYDTVYRLKRDYPHLRFVLNGGVKTLDAAATHLAHTDGVMIGRAAYDDPYLFAEVDSRIFGDPTPPRTRDDVLAGMRSYVDGQRGQGVPLGVIAKPLFNLYHGQRGGRQWRRALSETVHLKGAGWDTIERAFEVMRRAREGTPD